MQSNFVDLKSVQFQINQSLFKEPLRYMQTQVYDGKMEVCQVVFSCWYTPPILALTEIYVNSIPEFVQIKQWYRKTVNRFTQIRFMWTGYILIRLHDTQCMNIRAKSRGRWLNHDHLCTESNIMKGLDELALLFEHKHKLAMLFLFTLG